MFFVLEGLEFCGFYGVCTEVIFVLSFCRFDLLVLYCLLVAGVGWLVEFALVVILLFVACLMFCFGLLFIFYGVEVCCVV